VGWPLRTPLAPTRANGWVWWAAVAGLGVGGGWLRRHRRSPAVRVWTPGSSRRIHAGPLAVRVLGDAEPTTVLLHGLIGSGDVFGAGFDPLADHGGLVVPDLLGFGASMDLAREDFSLAAHLDALDAMASALGLDGAPLTVVGHSMGAVLALHWAARRERVCRVVAFCAPLYRDEEEARAHIGALGFLERLFALESPLARRTCALMCEHRGLAQWVAVAISPQLPVRLARHGVLHTWSAYLGGMNDIILHAGWQDALARLDTRGVPVVLAEGAVDPVPVVGRSRELQRRFRCVARASHPEAGHDLPVPYPDWSARLISR